MACPVLYGSDDMTLTQKSIMPNRNPVFNSAMPTITEHGATTFSSSISLVKTILGAGLLSIPLAFSTDGIVLGILLILLAALTSGYGMFLQAYVSQYVPRGHATFFNVCSITYPKLSVVFDFAIAIQCAGCALSYLVLVGDLMPTIVKIKGIEDLRTAWICISALIIVPLSFLRNLDSLKYSSILGLVAIFYLSVLVIAHYFVGDITLEGNIDLFPSSITGVFSTFSIVVFAYTGHQNMFSIINEAKDKSLSSLAELVNFAILLSTALFVAVGLTGYLTFGDIVNGNVILMYPASFTTTLARFCIVLMVTFSFPLMFHPARISVNNIYHSLNGEEEKEAADEYTSLLHYSQQQENLLVRTTNVVPLSNQVFNVITIALLVAIFTLAITIKSFALVLAIVGATGSTAISFILPGLFGWKLIGSESHDPTTLETTFKYASLGLAVWGVVVMVLCLYASVFLQM